MKKCHPRDAVLEEPKDVVNQNAKCLSDHRFSRSDFGVGVGGQGDPTEAYTRTPQGGESAVPTPPYAKSAHEKCPRQDSNLYAVSDTGPSNQPVYQFQHVGPNPLVTSTHPTPTHQSCSGRDSNPHEVNPHRVLNPARLPIPPPERIRVQCAEIGSGAPVEPRGIEPLTS